MEFINSFIDINDLPSDNLREVCLLARSNAGKSSLVNALAKQKVAFVSKTPGRTQTINLFSYSKNKRIADLPGYGYARTNKEKLYQFNQLLQEYVNLRQQLALVLQICDVSVITEQDIIIANQLNNQRFQHLIIFNKIDRLTPRQLQQAQNINEKKFYQDCKFIYASFKHKKNIDKIIQVINAI